MTIHANANNHNTHHGYGMGKKTIGSYLLGLFLSLLFTIIAFALVAGELMSGAALYVSLSILAILQLFAQVICFLRLNSSKEGKWNLFPFLFTILIIVVVVGGSLWIMYNLNYNMMN